VYQVNRDCPFFDDQLFDGQIKKTLHLCQNFSGLRQSFIWVRLFLCSEKAY
jgi:hypothetical protein